MTGQGADAARGRLDRLFEGLARVDLQVVVMAPPDVTRLAAQDRARAAAATAGLSSLLDEATAAARETALRSFARAGFSGTWAATDMAASVMTARDRVAAATALEEAAMAAVVEDLVDEETLDVLRSSSNELTGLTGMPAPGSLSALTGTAAINVRRPLHVVVLVAFTALGAGVWLTLGAGSGLLVLAIGVAVSAWLARRLTGDRR